MPMSPADPDSGRVIIPAALEMPGTALSEPWFLGNGMARFSAPSSPSSGSPH